MVSVYEIVWVWVRCGQRHSADALHYYPLSRIKQQIRRDSEQHGERETERTTWIYTRSICKLAIINESENIMGYELSKRILYLF